jgi:hypothetical protein
VALALCARTERFDDTEPNTVVPCGRYLQNLDDHPMSRHPTLDTFPLSNKNTHYTLAVSGLYETSVSSAKALPLPRMMFAAGITRHSYLSAVCLV